MTQAQTTSQSGHITNLQIEEKHKSKGYWADAWGRLVRNRFAVMGLIIILINIFVALFAPVLAPFPPDEQHREESNAVPYWLTQVFPTLRIADDNFDASGADIQVSTGDVVSEGDVLAYNFNDDGNDQTETITLRASYDGTVFVVGEEGSEFIQMTIRNVRRIAIPDGYAVAVDPTRPARLEPGMVLATEINGDGQILATDEFEIGIVYVTEDEILIREVVQGGYIPLRNQYPLGADSAGRDMLSRLMFGARVSLLVAFIGPLVSFLIGLPYGLVSGYAGGRVDNIMMRFVDLMYAFPSLIFIILLMALFRVSSTQLEPGSFAYRMSEIDRQTGGMFFIFIGIGLTSWMRLARITRGQVLALRETEFITAANALGASRVSIMRHHLMPNILGPVVISETLTIPTYIRYEAFLSFIGLGVNPPTPSWGNMIAEGSRVLQSYPHQALFPAIALFMIMFAFNFLGDGLRDALDPRLRGTT